MAEIFYGSLLTININYLVNTLDMKKYKVQNTKEAEVGFAFVAAALEEKVIITVALKILTNKSLLLSCSESQVFHDAFVFTLK